MKTNSILRLVSRFGSITEMAISKLRFDDPFSANLLQFHTKNQRLTIAEARQQRYLASFIEKYSRITDHPQDDTLGMLSEQSGSNFFKTLSPFMTHFGSLPICF